MKAIFRDHPFHTSDGNQTPILVQFLGNDLRRHVWIKKSIPDNLTYDLIGSAVVPFGPRFAPFESLSALVHKLTQDLVVTLSSVSKLFCGFGRAKTFTLALKEHRKFKGDFIIF
ncbi:MAG: hypothetical protein MUP18_02310, partial [Desulfobacterales bacterium]|nr:hypothetical protein [Desulfobacterales bacterium]